MSGDGGQVRRPGPKTGQPQREPPDAYRCQRIVVLQTAGAWNRWRCGRRVRNTGGLCVPHQTVADAMLVEPLAQPPEPGEA